MTSGTMSVEEVILAVVTRLDANGHRQSCMNCELGYCYDCILIEMTGTEYAIESARTYPVPAQTGKRGS